MTDIINLPTGDARLGELAGDITDLIHGKYTGLPFPSVLGVLEVVKYQLLRDGFYG
jgi:hypothetical protein